MGCKCTTNDLSDGHELTANINNNEHGGTTTPFALYLIVFIPLPNTNPSGYIASL